MNFDVNWLNDASWYVLLKNTEENATKLAEHCMKLTVVFIVSSRMRVAENPIVGYRAIQSPILHGWPLISSASIFSPLVSMSTWTDPGFWFGRDTQVPQRSPGAPGQSSGGGMGRSPKNVTARGWKNTYGDKKNKSIQTDIAWQYHNYHHLIHSLFYVQPFLSWNTKRSLRAPEPAKWSTMAAGSGM